MGTVCPTLGYCGDVHIGSSLFRTSQAVPTVVKVVGEKGCSDGENRRRLEESEERVVEEMIDG